MNFVEFVRDEIPDFIDCDIEHVDEGDDVTVIRVSVEDDGEAFGAELVFMEPIAADIKRSEIRQLLERIVQASIDENYE